MILGPQESFCDLIDNHMLAMEQAKTTKYYPLRPSASGYCARRLAYDLMDYHGYKSYGKEEKKPSVLRLLNFGHSVEFSALRNMDGLPGWDVKYKQQVLSMFRLDPTEPGTTGRLIEGSLDAVLWSDAHRALLDVKSVGDRWSGSFKGKWEELLDKYSNMKSLVPFGNVDAKEGYKAFYADSLEDFIAELNGDFLCDNLYQLNLYACSPFLVERGISIAVVYRYNKNDSRHMEIRFRPSQAVYQQTFQKFNSINQAVARRDPESIDRQSFLGSFRCAYCPHAKHCWGDADSLKAWFATFPEREWPVRLNELSNSEAAQRLAGLFADYTAEKSHTSEADKIETQILEICTQEKITKLQLDNKQVYEVKYLKSPKPHFELRRGKS